MRKELESLLIDVGIENPQVEIPDYNFGDLALNVKRLTKNENEQKEIIKRIKMATTDSNFTISVTGPFINFRASDDFLFKEFEPKRGIVSKNKTLVIDYSSPNIAKPFSVPHLRSTLIGNALSNLYLERGWNVIGINHLGDWGTQFGKLLAQYKEKNGSVNNIMDLYELYKQFHARAESDATLEDVARREFSKLEEGDAENLRLWERFRKISLDNFMKIYKILGIKFTEISGESESISNVKEVLKELKRKSLLVESEGAQIVDLSREGMNPAILIKKDGSTLYLLRDLATIIERKRKYNFDKIIYEVGSEQSVHFDQLKGLLKLMDYKWYEECTHVKHGLYNFEGEKMSARKGKVFLFEELLEIVSDEVRRKMKDRSDSTHRDYKQIVKDVALSAIIFNDLRTDRERDLSFNPTTIIQLNGDTGPYLQYTRTRLTSLLKQSQEHDSSNNYWSKLNANERRVARYAIKIEDSIDKCIDSNKPHFLAHSLLELASEINSYYTRERIIGSNNEGAKIRFVCSLKDYLDKGLRILGMPLMDEM